MRVGRDRPRLGDNDPVSVQDQVMELISAEVETGETARFDQEMLARMGELLELVAEPGFETTMLGAPTVGGPVRNMGHGIDGMLDVVGDWFETFEELRAEEITIVQVGDSVVLDVMQIATMQGVEIPTPSAMVLKFRGEKVAAVEFHLDQDQARASALAGFSEAS